MAESAHSAPDPTIVERCLKAADFEGCYRTLSERGSGQASGSSALSGYRDIDYRSIMRSEEVRKTVSIVNGAGGECKLVAYETVLDVCGTFVGKANVVGWTRSHVQTSCNFLGWCPGEQFNYGLSFFSESGRSALQFSILHRPTAYDMDKFLTSWIGMIRQRTDGDKLLEPGMPFVAPVIIR